MKRLYKYNNKRIARKAYNDGETIILYANKVEPNGVWISGYEMNKEDIKNRCGITSSDFDTVVNEFECYNCDYEMGYYTSFYVDVKITK